ncbi:Predicted ATPase of the ABC class [Alteribacillus persepolensis]|uniref:Predicted ATPase of the ABC class n=1 Tax=Alteribacillus persepolensis TaxID=568899 RepID=A0A1G7YV21_9BACI|nr:ABC-ATPase domain-containing protein [Alteribacillus persepolensis]SDH00358.1 Predicted ATPase of the ABC class [Alteribacillus persepolensis]
MQQLIQTLQRIDKKGYKAYNDIKGTYTFSDFHLHLDHIQADPYASPSRARVVLKRKALGLGAECDQTDARRIATIDFFANRLQHELHKRNGRIGIVIDGPGQEVLDRTAVVLHQNDIDIRLSIHLPARGRTILGKQAIDRLTRDLPDVVIKAVKEFNKSALMKQLELADQQEAIRHFLKENNYVTFIANGSVLPRKSGISNKPLEGDQVVPFQSPSSLEVEIDIPHRSTVKGMALKQGVNIIVGGGYHGKSTLLEAIERGIYNHREKDGREFVITNDSAVKVRAEDGRSVESVNISPFISNLPVQKDTRTFSTENASGSTSQAANIIESLEAGASCLLIDEDTSATNFMIRDARMQALVAKEKEPITPFIDKVKTLYDEHRVSTVLVVGGAGDYFDVADTVVMMEEYRPHDVTQKAKEIAKRYGSERNKEAGTTFGEVTPRTVVTDSFQARKGKKEKVSGKGRTTIMYGKDIIDLSGVEQLIDHSQTNAIANMIRYACKNIGQTASLSAILDFLEREVSEKGLDVLSPFAGKHPGDMAKPRRTEIAAAINRHRKLKIK